MKKVGLFEALYLSFYSKRLYRDVATNWGGYAILYLLMLVALSWISAVWQAQDAITIGFKKNAYDFFSQIPEIKVKDGEISTPQNIPYFIRNPENNKVIAIIDTSGKFKNLKEAKTQVLVTQSQIFVNKQKEKETRIYQIPKNITQTISSYYIYLFLQKVVGFIWIPLFITCVLVSFIFRLIQAFFYALIGKVFNYFYGANLTYGQITQITMVALTPAIIISTVKSILLYHSKSQLFLYFLLTILYMCYGIVVNKTEETQKD